MLAFPMELGTTHSQRVPGSQVVLILLWLLAALLSTALWGPCKSKLAPQIFSLLPSPWTPSLPQYPRAPKTLRITDRLKFFKFFQYLRLLPSTIFKTLINEDDFISLICQSLTPKTGQNPAESSQQTLANWFKTMLKSLLSSWMRQRRGYKNNRITNEDHV